MSSECCVKLTHNKAKLPICTAKAACCSMQIRCSLRVCTWKGVFFLLPSEKVVDIRLVMETFRDDYSHPAAVMARPADWATS